uniref:Glycoprotein 3 n=1 Tax=Porcine reproductive and respiratory syndrome virus TaxID=28344 RepID=A0A1B2LVE7_PRRSV|nr:glycoprotein 3 [Porcine reproductive and respiratory syndrome virus]QNH67645.1 ORF3 [Porcine reproductive and respiratory syndrome virus]
MARQCARFHLLFCGFISHVVHSALASGPNSTLCFWFPLAHGNTSFELTINYTICEPCLTRQAAQQRLEPGRNMWCKIGHTTCEERDHNELSMTIPSGYDNLKLEGYYAWLAFLSFSYAAQFHPELFGIGNVSRVFVDKKHQFICAEHDGQNSTVPIRYNISASYAAYYHHQVDGGNWFHLEWLRPFFSSWLVLNISWFLRHSPASPASRRIYQILRPTRPRLPVSWSFKTSTVSHPTVLQQRKQTSPSERRPNVARPSVFPSTSQ